MAVPGGPPTGNARLITGGRPSCGSPEPNKERPGQGALEARPGRGWAARRMDGDLDHPRAAPIDAACCSPPTRDDVRRDQGIHQRHCRLTSWVEGKRAAV